MRLFAFILLALILSQAFMATNGNKNQSSTSDSAKTKAKRVKRHVSRDGTVRDYHYDTQQWILISSPKQEEKDTNETKPMLAIEGSLFPIHNYFPYLHTYDNLNVLYFISFEYLVILLYPCTNKNTTTHIHSKEFVSMDDAFKYHCIMNKSSTNINNNNSDTNIETSNMKDNERIIINNHCLYIGNMYNNGLIERKSNDQEHADTGRSVWDTSIEISKYLEEWTLNEKDSKYSVKNTKILELGSGTGLVGIVVSILQYDSIISKTDDNSNKDGFVWITDLKYCIENIKQNIIKNRFIFNKQLQQYLIQDQKDDNKETSFLKNVSVFELNWQDPKKSIQQYNQHEHIDITQKLKDKSGNESKVSDSIELIKFEKMEKNSIDMIIASDVIWIEELVPMLVDTLDFLNEDYLDSAHGVIIIAEQIRSNVVHNLFWKLMSAKGFLRVSVSTNDKILLWCVQKL